MAVNPRKRFGLEGLNDIFKNFTIFETDKSCKVDPAEFLSMGKATPFAGWEVRSRCILTVCSGKTVFDAAKEKTLL